MKLSKHLGLKEVTKSQTATRKGISNQPTPEHLSNLQDFAAFMFEPLRARVSKHRRRDTPLTVSSGYRSEALNEDVGGSSKSQHCKGQALDLDLDGLNDPEFTNADLFFMIAKLFTFDQVIWEFGDNEKPDWVHVSYEMAGNRGRITIAEIDANGETVYRDITRAEMENRYGQHITNRTNNI